LEEDVIETAGICQNCFIKFNEIDEHQSIVEKIQMDLINQFNSSSNSGVYSSQEQDVKEEIVEHEYYGMEEEIIDSDYITAEVYEADVVKSELKQEKKRFMKQKIQQKNHLKGQKQKRNPDEGLIMIHVDGNKVYQCDICKKVYKDRYKLKNHKETHTNQRNICCNECGALFKTLSCLYSHKKIHKERLYYFW
jgi:uncharacterized Zn-finger protein